MAIGMMRENREFIEYKIECIFYDDETIEFIEREFKLIFVNELEVAKWAVEFSEMYDELCEIKVTSWNYPENIVVWLGLY